MKKIIVSSLIVIISFINVFTERCEGCISVPDNLDLNICAEYKGIIYNFTMNYIPVPSDPEGLFWKMDVSTFRTAIQVFLPELCISVPDNLDFNVECAEYKGVEYKFTMNYKSIASDPEGLFWKMDVSKFKQVNHAPVLTPIGSQSVNETASLTFTINATDPDSDALTYSATGLPSGATFNPSTRIFTWTPSTGASGNYNITFTVKDNGNPSMSDSETVTISVKETTSVLGTYEGKWKGNASKIGDNQASFGTIVFNPTSAIITKTEIKFEIIGESIVGKWTMWSGAVGICNPLDPSYWSNPACTNPLRPIVWSNFEGTCTFSDKMYCNVNNKEWKDSTDIVGILNSDSTMSVQFTTPGQTEPFMTADSLKQST